ncbi:1722_t:CDS:2, partial [Gigaspora rosea]
IQNNQLGSENENKMLKFFFNNQLSVEEALYIDSKEYEDVNPK